MSYLQRTGTAINDINWEDLSNFIFTMRHTVFDVYPNNTISDLYKAYTVTKPLLIYNKLVGLPCTINFDNKVVPSYASGILIHFNHYANPGFDQYSFSALVADDDTVKIGIAYLMAVPADTKMEKLKYKALVP